MLIKTGILTEQLLPGIMNVSTCPSPAEVKSANTFKNEKWEMVLANSVYVCGAEGRRKFTQSWKSEK